MTEASPYLGFTILYVPDVEATVTFYEQAFGLRRKSAPPIELGIVTQAVEALYQRAIQAGAIPVKEPEQKPWGQIVGYVRDLNGFLVEICTEVEAPAS
jgi:lactoylglutathione lyase